LDRVGSPATSAFGAAPGKAKDSCRLFEHRFEPEKETAMSVTIRVEPRRVVTRNEFRAARRRPIRREKAVVDRVLITGRLLW
jgi:hypothetical protein